MFRPTRVPHPALAIAAVLACADARVPTEPATAAAGPLPVPVTGIVRDSLGGGPISDALVTTTVGNALTDADGRFRVFAPRGRASFRVAHRHYSLKSFETTVDENASVALSVAPLGPTVLGCDVRRGRMWMLVRDLQGRKTVVRRDSSGVTLGEGADRRWVVAHEFSWGPLDALTWLVEGPPASFSEISTAVWRLFDTDGNVRPHRCGGQAVPVVDGEL